MQQRRTERKGLRERVESPLRALQLIETVREGEPLRVVPIVRPCGNVVSAREAMDAKVQWANRAGYEVLTRDVPKEFRPYNAIIRVTETEDYLRDYLARIVSHSAR